MRLIDADKLLEQFNKQNTQITFDVPVEEVLGKDVDLDDFAILVEDAVQAYKKMVIDTINSQPTAYDVDKVVEQLEESAYEIDIVEKFQKNRAEIKPYKDVPYKMLNFDDVISIVKSGGITK